MFNVPDRFNVDVNVSMKDFIPKDLKPAEKKRIKDTVKSVRLVCQITGEEIPSVVNEEYNCQVIQFYDIELANIKDAAFMASIYQSMIKPFCIIRMHDAIYEVYSLARKRLNQLDTGKVFVESSLLTERFQLNAPDSARDRLLKYVDFVSTKNRNSKVSMYNEWFCKAYLVTYSNAYAYVGAILDGNIWYDEERTSSIISKYMELVSARESLKKVNTNVERMQTNKNIKSIMTSIDNENF